MYIYLLSKGSVLDCIATNNMSRYDIGDFIKELIEKNGNEVAIFISPRQLSEEQTKELICIKSR